MHPDDAIKQIQQLCHEMSQPLCYSKMTLELADFNAFGDEEINILKTAIEKLSVQVDKIRTVINDISYSPNAGLQSQTLT